VRLPLHGAHYIPGAGCLTVRSMILGSLSVADVRVGPAARGAGLGVLPLVPSLTRSLPGGRDAQRAGPLHYNTNEARHGYQSGSQCVATPDATPSGRPRRTPPRNRVRPVRSRLDPPSPTCRTLGRAPAPAHSHR